MLLSRRKFVVIGLPGILTALSDCQASVAEAVVIAGSKAAKSISKGGVKSLMLGLYGITFLAGWYFKSIKVEESTPVNAEYERLLNGRNNSAIKNTKSKFKRNRKPKGIKSIPKDAIVPAYFETKLEKSKPVESNGEREIQISATTDLIGYGDAIPEVQQKFVLLDENNNSLEELVETVKAIDGAGSYETHTKFTLPASAKGKKYTAKTTLLVHNTAFQENRYKIS